MSAYGNARVIGINISRKFLFQEPVPINEFVKVNSLLDESLRDIARKEGLINSLIYAPIPNNYGLPGPDVSRQVKENYEAMLGGNEVLIPANDLSKGIWDSSAYIYSLFDLEDYDSALDKVFSVTCTVNSVMSSKLLMVDCFGLGENLKDVLNSKLNDYFVDCSNLLDFKSGYNRFLK